MTTSNNDQPYLLDANVLFRVLYTHGSAPDDVLRPLQPVSRRLLLGYGTLWEAMAKVHRGKSNLQPKDLQPELDTLRALRIRLIPITLNDVLSAIALPDIHRDPFDRMLIVSSDRTLHLYGVPVMAL